MFSLHASHPVDFGAAQSGRRRQLLSSPSFSFTFHLSPFWSLFVMRRRFWFCFLTLTADCVSTWLWRWHRLCVSLFFFFLRKKEGRRREKVESCSPAGDTIYSRHSPLLPRYLCTVTPSSSSSSTSSSSTSSSTFSDFPILFFQWRFIARLDLNSPLSSLAPHILNFPSDSVYPAYLLCLFFYFTPATNCLSLLFYIPSLAAIVCCFSSSLPRVWLDATDVLFLSVYTSRVELWRVFSFVLFF